MYGVCKRGFLRRLYSGAGVEYAPSRHKSANVPLPPGRRPRSLRESAGNPLPRRRERSSALYLPPETGRIPHLPPGTAAISLPKDRCAPPKYPGQIPPRRRGHVGGPRQESCSSKGSCAAALLRPAASCVLCIRLFAAPRSLGSGPQPCISVLEQLANRVAPCKDAEHGHLLERTQDQGGRGGRAG